MNRFHSVSVTLSVVVGLLVLSLAFALSLLVREAFERQQSASNALTAIQLSRDLFFAEETLQVERGVVITALRAPGAADKDTIARVKALRSQSRTALDKVASETQSRQNTSSTFNKETFAESLGRYEKATAEATAGMNLPMSQRRSDLLANWTLASRILIEEADNQSTALSRSLTDIDPFVDEMIRMGRLAWDVRSDAGVERTQFATVLDGPRPPSVASLRQLAEATGKIDSPWSFIEADAKQSSFPPVLKKAVQAAEKSYFTDLRTKRRALLDELVAGKSPRISDQDWLQLSDPALESLGAISETTLALTATHVAELADAATRKFTYSVASIVLSLLLTLFAALYLRARVIKPLGLITRAMQTVVGGDLDFEIPMQDRQDEIGRFAQTLGMFRDGAVERERLETELLKNRSDKETAEASSRVKSEFLATMSHELRTPLNAIIGFSEVMKEQTLGPLSAQYGEYSGHIFDSGSHLLSLINDILDITKYDAGHLELNEEAFDLAAVVKDCIDLVGPQAAKARISLHTNFACAPVLFADERRVRQVMLNLLSNAIKFTPEGGQVCVGLERDENYLTISVVDTGIGIKQADLEKAFSRFGQIDSSLSRKYDGTGLGLPLAKNLVELHGGTLEMTSAAGRGTSVKVKLGADRIVDRQAVERSA